ncbi:nuclear formin-like protein [Plasmodium berghei]|uniref:Nuclear formin-like protein MISFIT n=2 Tax=Plasmodium berghei TaxID=5821 RepID=A0A509ANE6_PLABA|nr:male-inherited sporulation factor important for transmission [Plasmodium berghei ANKA]SCL95443.1 nuclear formin-like protein [Plasmodium berghei]SCM16257.1 nuclear formin-like protein [Plasmodium berghei]SCM18053.1 nuclear formin-like protein [Plasmodium berghei]SCN26500.1 nuclear formin-like protein [Plasmodium berghei]VUC56379.1 male-inherited sporulation factor important for transmission [Plasmodium berghei ANKA]|eukprot:XP_034422181.1 male-inherited sporulation factor important for transmission [Plasmodium berghei ANKA]
MAVLITLEKENEKLKKLTGKLLYLLNKYRHAYLMSIDLINFYDEVIEKKDDSNYKELEEFYKKKRPWEGIIDEEMIIRKKLKNNLCYYEGKEHTKKIKTIETNDSEMLHSKGNDGNDSSNCSLSGIKIFKGDDSKLQDNNMENEDEKYNKNTSDYVSLGALDFSAYKEDSDGHIKYYEKNKTDIKVDKTKKNNNNFSKYMHQSDVKKKNVLNQSIYMKNNNVKSSQIRILPHIHKNIYNADNSFSKLNSAKKLNALNTYKSVYINSNIMHKNIGMDKKIVKNELNKNEFLQNNNLKGLNKSVYIGRREKSTCATSNSIIVPNRNNRMSGPINESLILTSKNSLINKDGIKKQELLNKKMSVIKANNTHNNNIPLKKMNTLSILKNNNYISNKNGLNKSIYFSRSNTLMSNDKKKKTNDSYVDQAKVGTVGDSNLNRKAEHINNLNFWGKNEVLDVEISKEIGIAIKDVETENTEQNSKKIFIDEKLGIEKSDKINFPNVQKLSYSPLTLEDIEKLIKDEEKDKEISVNNNLNQSLIKENDFACMKKNICIDKDNLKNLVCLPEKNQTYIKIEKNCDDNGENISQINELKKEDKINGDNNKNTNFGASTINSENINNEVVGYIENPLSDNLIKVEKKIEEKSSEYALVKKEGNISMENNSNKMSYNEKCKITKDLEEENMDIDNKKDIKNIENINTKDNVKKLDYSAISCGHEEINRKNIILNINDEIKEKIMERECVSGKVGNNSEENVFKKMSEKKMLISENIRKNLMSSLEKETGTKCSNINNRANLNIEIDLDCEYVSLDIVNIDLAINEGLYNYKKNEESYIECDEQIKDIKIYNDILKSEKEICSDLLFIKKENQFNNNSVILFKSSNEIKNEISKYVGMSIFDCINKFIIPTNSLVNDNRLSIWFTKKKKNNNNMNRSKDNNFDRIENYNDDSKIRRNFIFKKKSEGRLSCMGYFSQPITIMLSSLKRRSEFGNLKNIITSIILCTCDSSMLEIILHTIPDENSKNYQLWKTSIKKLYTLIGDRKKDILRNLIFSDKDKTCETHEKDEREGYDENNLIEDKNKYNELNLKTYDFMNTMDNNGYRNFFNSSFSSEAGGNTPINQNNYFSTVPLSKTDIKTEKYEEGKENNINILEDEKFCLFICTINDIHKRFQYLLLIENYDFIYSDLIKHIQNKLNNIDLIINKHMLLKQLFCNVLFLCNWLNEPKCFKWFQWNDVFNKLYNLNGFLENGRISRERCILLLLAEHTGEIFTEKELNELKKTSKLHIKDLYDKSIDFINCFLELKNQLETEEFKKSCCIFSSELEDVGVEKCSDNFLNDKVLKNDKFLEKVKDFVKKYYKQMVYIIWNLVLLIKKYLIVMIWLGDVKPFYPLFSYLDEGKKIKYSEDLFVNLCHFFESYNKYFNIVKQSQEELQKGIGDTSYQGQNEKTKNIALNNSDDFIFSADYFEKNTQKEANGIANDSNYTNFKGGNKPNYEVCELRKNKIVEMNNRNYNNGSEYTANNSYIENNDISIKNGNNVKGMLHFMKNNGNLKTENYELKHRKSLTNTIDYGCEIRRKSIEKEKGNNNKFIKGASFENMDEAEFDSSA